jgi:hypothetical protein
MRSSHPRSRSPAQVIDGDAFSAVCSAPSRVPSLSLSPRSGIRGHKVFRGVSNRCLMKNRPFSATDLSDIQASGKRTLRNLAISLMSLEALGFQEPVIYDMMRITGGASVPLALDWVRERKSSYLLTFFPGKSDARNAFSIVFARLASTCSRSRCQNRSMTNLKTSRVGRPQRPRTSLCSRASVTPRVRRRNPRNLQHRRQ